MLKLSVDNQTRVKLPEGMKFEYWLKKTVKVLKAEKEQGRVELCFIDEKAIQKLNREYRGKDKVTDVLSFSFMEAERFPGDDLAGQIFIEPITAKKQAAEKNVIWKDEMEYLFVHALLHLFGYDHENETDFRNMFGLQGKIMPGQKWATFEDQILRESFGGRGASAGNHEQ